MYVKNLRLTYNCFQIYMQVEGVCVCGGGGESAVKVFYESLTVL